MISCSIQYALRVLQREMLNIAEDLACTLASERENTRRCLAPWRPKVAPADPGSITMEEFKQGAPDTHTHRQTDTVTHMSAFIVDLSF